MAIQSAEISPDLVKAIRAYGLACQGSGNVYDPYAAGIIADARAALVAAILADRPAPPSAMMEKVHADESASEDDAGNSPGPTCVQVGADEFERIVAAMAEDRPPSPLIQEGAALLDELRAKAMTARPAPPVERAARAAWESRGMDWDDLDPAIQRQECDAMRAAIASLRSPTPEMRVAMFEATADGCGGDPDEMFLVAWQAAIDAVLSPAGAGSDDGPSLL